MLMKCRHFVSILVDYFILYNLKLMYRVINVKGTIKSSLKVYSSLLAYLFLRPSTTNNKCGPILDYDVLIG